MGSIFVELNVPTEPDLHPLYPTITYIASLLSPNICLSSSQKRELVGHCLSRFCLFGELSGLQYLLSDPQAQSYVDLGYRDDDGVGFVGLVIQGFGADSDRDVEREECVRLLISQGANLGPDNGNVNLLNVLFQSSKMPLKLVGPLCTTPLYCPRQRWSHS